MAYFVDVMYTGKYLHFEFYKCCWCTAHVYSSREIPGLETEIQLGMVSCWLCNLLPDGASWGEDC